MTKHSTDREMDAALEADAAYLEAMGQDPGPTLQDIFIDTPGWFEDDYEPSN
jgi:hypothetical protein